MGYWPDKSNAQFWGGLKMVTTSFLFSRCDVGSISLPLKLGWIYDTLWFTEDVRGKLGDSWASAPRSSASCAFTFLEPRSLKNNSRWAFLRKRGSCEQEKGRPHHSCCGPITWMRSPGTTTKELSTGAQPKLPNLQKPEDIYTVVVLSYWISEWQQYTTCTLSQVLPRVIESSNSDRVLTSCNSQDKNKY